MQSTVTDQEFIELWKQHSGPQSMAQFLAVNVRNIHARRRAIEARQGIKLNSKTRKDESEPAIAGSFVQAAPPNVRYGLTIPDGVVIVFSDAHYWPDETTVAHQALLGLIRELKPKAVINNGDAFDGAMISRFPRIGWDHRPSVVAELRAVQEALGQIEEAAPKACKLIWTMGNHDARYESRLAQAASEYEGIHGFHLKDHFPFWQPCWSVWINEDTDPTVIKHRFKGGFGAGRANAIAASTHMVTGHTHVLAVQPVTNYLKTLYGVQTGTLADPNGPQFADYTEDNPKDWRSGFAVLTFHKGKLLMPELVQVCGDSEYQFRGKVWRI